MLATISLKKIPWLSSAIYEILSKVGNFCVNRYRECTFFFVYKSQESWLEAKCFNVHQEPSLKLISFCSYQDLHYLLSDYLEHLWRADRTKCLFDLLIILFAFLYSKNFKLTWNLGRFHLWIAIYIFRNN